MLFRKNIFAGVASLPSSPANGWKIPSGIRTYLPLVAAESNKPITATSMRYCMDTAGRYRIDCDNTMKPTPYYGFLLVQPLETSGNSTPKFTVDGGYRVTAYFATTEGGYRELSMSTIVTDFKK